MMRLPRASRSPDPLLRVAARGDLVEHGHDVRGRATVQRPRERRRLRRTARRRVRARRCGHARGERRGVQAVLGRADPVRVDRLRPRGSASPRQRQEELLGGGPTLPDDVVRHVVRMPVRKRADRATIAIICAEIRARSSRARSSEIALSLPRRPHARQPRDLGLRSAGASPVSGPARTTPHRACRNRGLVDEESPDPFVRHPSRPAPRCRPRDSGARRRRDPAPRSPSRRR